MKIFIYIDKYNDLAKKTRNELIDVCNRLGIENVSSVKDSDLICSIGGDGTFLKSSKLDFYKPIIGINTGTLGYLTEINPDNIQESIENILNENYHIENRMMLEGEIITKDNEKIKIPESLNEIAISKNTFGVVRFDVLINDKLINSYTADGILVSTPTGLRNNTSSYVLYDGQPIEVSAGDEITIKKSDKITKIIKLEDRSFIDTIRENIN